MSALSADIDRVLHAAKEVLPRRVNFVKAAFQDCVDEDYREDDRIIVLTPRSSKVGEVRRSKSMFKTKGKHEHRPRKKQTDDFEQAPYELFPSSSLWKMMEWESIGRVGAGLNNLGNTCYMNSILQCLSYIPALANLMVLKEHSKNCTHNVGMCVACILERHIRRALSSHSAISPTELAYNVRVVNKRFRVGRQEDAQEYLRCLVDKFVSTSLKDVEKKLNPRVAETTLMHQIFRGYLRSQVKCSKCGYCSSIYECFLDISLGLFRCKTLADSLKKFTEKETLDGDNKYRCSTCSALVPATKQLTIHVPPNILVCHFKRFELGGRYDGKISKFVEFPLALNIGEYLSVREPCDYELISVLVHAGHSIHCGHYYSFVKAANGLWYCMDDCHVTQVSLKTVLSAKAYLLFYKRKRQVEVYSKSDEVLSPLKMIQNDKEIYHSSSDEEIVECGKAEHEISLSQTDHEKVKKLQKESGGRREHVTAVARIHSLRRYGSRKSLLGTSDTIEETILSPKHTSPRTRTDSGRVFDNESKKRDRGAIEISSKNPANSRSDVFAWNEDEKPAAQYETLRFRGTKERYDKREVEYDKGKTRKVKKRRIFSPLAGETNPFQIHQGEMKNK